MKPASSPNWLEYDKSGKVVRRRFYSTDPVAEVSRNCRCVEAPIAQPELALPAKPPRPRRAQ